MYCKFVQWRIACHLDAGTPLSDRLNRHLQKCPNCLQTYQRLGQVDQQLQIQNPDYPDFDLEGFHQRISARLSRNQKQDPVTRQQNLRFVIVSAAGLAAVLLISAGIWWKMQSSHILVIRQKQTFSQAQLNQIRQFLNPDLDMLQEDWVKQQPLQKEIGNLTQDAKKAFQFFSNCLPDV